MKIIAHRRNTIADLIATPQQYGIEVDIRSHGHHLIVQHDPYLEGEDFEQWLDAFHHGTVILNVKEEGLEDRLSTLMSNRGIADYFYLDQSFPFLYKTARRGECRCAVRVSEFESVDTALAMTGMVDWIWVDAFTRFPLDLDAWSRLKNAGFKLCLVSPELLGRDAHQEIRSWRRQFASWGVEPDAVCTKISTVGVWEETL